MIKEHGLEEHEWLQQMFGIRDQWIPSYFRDVPMGSISQDNAKIRECQQLLQGF